MKYTSKDTSIATVSSSGLVTGQNPGTTAIEVRDDSDKYLGQIPTTVVSSAAYVPTTGITLSSTSVQLKYAYGTSKQITATVTPSNATNKTVKWTSSNPSALSCVDGYLKCLKSGSGNVIVTAETADGQSATCTVSIVENGTVVNSVTPDTINASADGGTYDIAVNITNRDGYYSGYKVYAGSQNAYRLFTVSDQTESGFKLTIPKNTGDARTFSITVMGIDADEYSSITVNQAYSNVEAGFAYSSTHWVYDKKDGVEEDRAVDTTYYYANQDPSKGKTGYYHVYDPDNNDMLVSGGDIVYIDCAPEAFESIYQRTTTSKPWLIKRSYHEYRRDVGGMIGIDVRESNTTGIRRTAYLRLPGGHSYPVVQDA